MTYRELPNYVTQIHSFFTKEGIRKNAKILFWGTNCPEYAVLLLAAFATGRVSVPIDYRNSPESIKAIIDKTKPQFAFISKYFKSDFIKAENIKVFFIEELFEKLQENKKEKDFRRLLKNKSYTNPNQLVEIIFTSGTTGVPKGVVIRQRNILTNIEQVQSSLPNLNCARIVSVLPLSHMFEQVIGLFLVVGEGATVFYLPRVNSFRIMTAFCDYQPTHQIFVPQLLKILWEKIEDKVKEKGEWENFQRALLLAPFLPVFIRKILFGKIHDRLGGKLKLFACGGAPLDKKIGENWDKVGLPVIEGYGATEVTAIATVNPYKNIRYGSAGKPIEGVKLSIDENREIWIKSSAVASGYYNDSERTRKVFTRKGYRTGDIGEMDKNGYLHIKGRDVFKIVLSSGEKVFVEDLETRIMEDKRVKEACVVAVQKKDGDLVHAYFIPQKGVKESLRNIAVDINSRLESKQQITSYALWPFDDFPRTPTLKIDRKQVFDVANKLIHADEVKVKDNTVNFLDITDVLAKVSGIPKERIGGNDILTADLGLDSISRVELVSLSEEYLGIVLDEGAITATTTVAQLIDLAKHAENIEEVKLPTWQFTWWGQLIHNISVKYLLIPFHSFIIRIKSPKNIPLIPPGSVVIFNHPGVMDGVCVLRILAKQGNLKVVTDATASVWENKSILGPIGEIIVGGLPLYETGQKMFEVLKLNSDLLDQGYILMFAPQGTMQRREKEDPFKMGIGYLLKELNRPVTIIRIKGYREIWPAPKEDIAQAKFKYLIPRKRGAVKVAVSKSIIKDWSKMSIIQITNYLEEKYREM